MLFVFRGIHWIEIGFINSQSQCVCVCVFQFLTCLFPQQPEMDQRMPLRWEHCTGNVTANVQLPFSFKQGKYSFTLFADLDKNPVLGAEIEGALLKDLKRLLGQLPLMPNLKAIANHGVGYNHIDVKGKQPSKAQVPGNQLNVKTANSEPDTEGASPLHCKIRIVFGQRIPQGQTACSSMPSTKNILMDKCLSGRPLMPT